jgi:hypothetical protein
MSKQVLFHKTKLNTKANKNWIKLNITKGQSLYFAPYFFCYFIVKESDLMQLGEIYDLISNVYNTSFEEAIKMRDVALDKERFLINLGYQQAIKELRDDK